MELNANPLWYFINERHAIYLRKSYATHGTQGIDPLYNSNYDPLGPGAIPGAVTPDEARTGIYTHDPILRTWRFCNVFRELDRVTVWVRQNIREPFADHPHLWYMLATARTINWPPTLSFLMDEKENPGAWPSHEGFTPKKMGDALDKWKALDMKVYTGAYMIRAESDSNKEWYSWTKQQYVAQIVLGSLWKNQRLFNEALDPRTDPEVDGPPSLELAWDLLKQFTGWGPFMSFQTVLEWRHTRYLKNAADATTWAAIGPGSTRGLNRLFGRPVGFKVPQAQALKEMSQLMELSRTNLGPHVPPLEMEDIQNSLCETDKYLRVKSGLGEPRSKYVPGRGH